jgi:hypothetical protein
MAIPTSEPTELRAGDTWAWRREDLSDYPASAGWTLTYYFRNATHKFDVAATSDGDAFAVAVAKANTGKTPGWYDWLAVVTSTTERFEVATGRTQVLYNLAADAVYDGRTFARTLLDYVEAALLNRATTDQLDTVNAALGDRSLQRDKAGLITLRSQLKSEVTREDAAAGRAAGKPSRSRLLIRFAS